NRKIVPFKHVADHACSDHLASRCGIHLSPMPTMVVQTRPPNVPESKAESDELASFQTDRVNTQDNVGLPNVRLGSFRRGAWVPTTVIGTGVAVGTRISSRAPRTEPYVRLSRIRLPPRVCDGKANARPRICARTRSSARWILFLLWSPRPWGIPSRRLAEP